MQYSDNPDLNPDVVQIRPIATIRTDFPEKFGIPRQPGLVPGLRACVIFEPEYRNIDALREIDGYDYLWLIFGFSKNRSDASWSPTVRPPRLGGEVKVGVFASRSPYRPNYLGLSSVRLLEVDRSDPSNPCLWVGGADLLDGTPIYDIKPYSAYSDSHPDAASGFAVSQEKFLQVDFPENLLDRVAESKREPLIGVLEQDPRSAYQKREGSVYGLRFSDYDIRFFVEGDILRVTEVESAGAERIK